MRYCAKHAPILAEHSLRVEEQAGDEDDDDREELEEAHA